MEESDLDALISKYFYPMFIRIEGQSEPVYGYIIDENGFAVGGDTMAPVVEFPGIFSPKTPTALQSHS